MVKKSKLFLGLVLSVIVSIPALANQTDITLSGTLEDVVSLQIEVSTDGKIVSKDDMDSSSNIAANETLNFGNVNPLGLDTSTNLAVINRAGTSTNGTAFIVNSMVLSTTNVLFAPLESSVLLPKGNNKGAVYFTEGAIQLRSLRTGGGNMVVDAFNVGDFEAVVGTSALTFTATTNLSTSILDAAADGNTPDLNDFVTLTNDISQPLDVGIVVPYTLKGLGAKNTVVEFRGT